MENTMLTIDGGTTNTRLYLLENCTIRETVKLSIGIRDTLTESGKADYQHTLQKEIAALAEKSASCPEAVVCTGMIGSETGLYTCPHVSTPITFAGLAEKLQIVSLPDISPLPFAFVPGLKTFDTPAWDGNTISLDTLADMDIMRGEETELCGLSAALKLKGAHTFVLPGSHMKTVTMDANGRITGFHTALTGEMLRCLSEHTILQASLHGAFTKNPDRDALLRGAALERKLGLAKALFKVRILDKSVGGLTEEVLFSFLLGILLSADTAGLITSGHPVVVAGSDPFRQAYEILLTEGGVPVHRVSDDVADCASAYGASWLWVKQKGGQVNP